MLQDAGFSLDIQALTYPQPWRDICQNSGSTAFNGVCQIRASGYNEETHLTAKYTPEGAWSMTNKPIPGITDVIKKARTEPDLAKQADLVKQVQRELALYMPDFPMPGDALGFTLNWPWLKNYGLYTPGGLANFSSSRVFTEYWYDASAKT